MLAGVRNIPCWPPVLERLTASIRSSLNLPPQRRGVENLGPIIASDAAIAACVLGASNRLPGREVCDLNLAAGRIGFERLSSTVLSVRALRGDEMSQWDYGEYVKIALMRATAAEMLAGASCGGGITRGDAYTCGLLSDIGRRALAWLMPKAYRRAAEVARRGNRDICEVERDVIGTDHTVVGRRLARLWRLGDVLHDVIWLHRQPVEAIPGELAHRNLIILIKLADAVASARSGVYPRPTPGEAERRRLAEHLNISTQALDEVRRNLADKPGSVEADVVGSERSGADEIQARACECLAEINLSLLEGKCALAGEAESLKAAREFTARAGEATDLVQVLQTIARAFASACGAVEQPAGAYAILPGMRHVIMARLESSGQVSYRSVEVKETLLHEDGIGAGRGDKSEIPPGLHEALGWLAAPGCRHRALYGGGFQAGGVFYRAGDEPAEQSLAPLAESAGLVLALVVRYERAATIGESLSGATASLSAQQQDVAAKKTLRAIGRMAAGAGHELNNPLAVVVGRAQMLAQRASTQEDRAAAEQIIKKAGQVSDIISALMDFASPAAPRFTTVAPRALLEDALERFRNSGHPQAADLNADIEVGSEVPPVRADRDQMLTVLKELLVNAARAGRDAGELRVSLSARYDELSDAVLIAVCDNGRGMAPETAEDVFVPFLSESRAGRRRGMGLAMAKRYVENNGGEIWITTVPGEGTGVYIRLPAGKKE